MLVRWDNYITDAALNAACRLAGPSPGSLNATFYVIDPTLFYVRPLDERKRAAGSNAMIFPRPRCDSVVFCPVNSATDMQHWSAVLFDFKRNVALVYDPHHNASIIKTT